MAHAKELGFDNILERAVRTAVDQMEQRPLALRVEARREGQQHVDLISSGSFERGLAGGAQVERRTDRSGDRGFGERDRQPAVAAVVRRPYEPGRDRLEHACLNA